MAKIKVFISYSREDYDRVYPIYTRLLTEGYDPWMDKSKILTGQDWELEVAKIIRESSFFVACFSNNVMNSSGYVHKELKLGLEMADRQPEGHVYIIPIRLEECEVPLRYQSWDYCDFYNETDYEKLFKSIEYGIEQRGLAGFEFNILKGPDAGKKYKLFTSLITIGRGRDNLVQLSDEGVSSLHAMIEIRKSMLRFKHLSEKKDTIIHSNKSDVMLSRDTETIAELNNGDIIEIGKTRMKIILINIEHIHELKSTS